MKHSHICGGDADSLETIMLQGGDVSVRENLLHAFRHLRTHDPRVLWVDTLCIDQSNVRERNHQVGQMASIYSKAQVVLVWLGEGGIDSDRAMNLLQESYEFLLSLEGGPTSYPSPTAGLTQNDKMTK